MSFERTELGEEAWVLYAPAFVPDAEAAMARLVEILPLQAERLSILGREVSTPRLTSWHGDPGCSYRYSGRDFEPQAWTPDLLSLRAALRLALGTDFNTVLANLYRDGRDSMGWHADDEPELGPRAPDDLLIASISLGAARRFAMRHRRRAGERREWTLGGGDLLVMGGATQRRWQHGVPKTALPVGPRLNLTFRLVLPARGDDPRLRPRP